MLTRPAEIDTERKKIASAPVLLIEFPNLGVRYSTRDYTWDNAGTLESFTGKLANGSVPSFSVQIQETLGGLAGMGKIKVKIGDWQGSTRSELFSTSGDISNEPVNVYLKYDTASNLKTNALLLFTGRVETWQVQKDIISIDIKPDIDGLKNKLLTEHTDSGKYYPIQYGDFRPVGTGLEVTYLLRDGEFTPYFAQTVPAIALKENGKTIHLVASHELFSKSPLSIFYKRDGQFVNLTGVSASLDAAPPYSLTMFINSNSYGRMARWPTEAGANNQNANWRQVVDGKSTTSAFVDAGGGSDIAVQNPKFSTVSEAQLLAGGLSGVYFKAVIQFGTIDVDGFTVQISNGVSTTTHGVGLADANQIREFNFHTGITDFEAADGTEIHIFYGGTAGGPGDLCEVKDIKVVAYVEPPAQDEPVYLTIAGKTFQTDWGGRKTVGGLIGTASEVIEDLLREAGFTEFRTGMFDQVHNDLNALGIEAKMTILENKEVRELVDEISRGHFLATLWSQSGWGLVHRYPSRLAFSWSGDTASPRGEDIFTQTPNLNWFSSQYSENPLMRLNLNRTKKPVDQVVLKFGVADGEYLYEVSAGTAGQDTEEIELFGIGDKTSATNLLNEIKNLYLIQRAVVTFEAFWNSIIFEPGDVINVRHPNLSDSILQGTVNNTKWQIIEFKPKFRPNKIQIKAIEVA